jgi:hypothetical protein
MIQRASVPVIAVQLARMKPQPSLKIANKPLAIVSVPALPTEVTVFGESGTGNQAKRSLLYSKVTVVLHGPLPTTVTWKVRPVQTFVGISSPTTVTLVSNILETVITIPFKN